MTQRIALAVLLIGCLAASTNAQKDKPKPTSQLTWETVAADKATRMTTKRASVPGGWLVLVQIDEEMSLTFVPDTGHRWSDDSPSDRKVNIAGDKPKFERINAVTAKLKAALDESREAAQAERDNAAAARRQADEERKRLLDQSDKAKKAKQPKKGDKDDQASDANKEAERRRIAEALGLAAREQADKARAIAEQARAKEEAARQEAHHLKEKVEVITGQLQKQLVETKKLFEHTRANDELARAEAAQTAAEVKRLQAELEVAKRDIERLKQLLDKRKK